MHINSMPDLVLRLIFHKVPLQDLFNVGCVCLLWRKYQLESGQRVCSLTLLIGGRAAQSLITKSCFTLKYRDLLLNDDGTQMYSSQYLHKRFHLTYNTFSLNNAVNLLNIFPNISTLEIAIVITHKPIFSPIVTIFTQWSPTLKSLKMDLKIKNRLTKSIVRASAEEFVNLLDMINSMQSLKHLTIDADISIQLFLHYLRSINSFDLPILGQLAEFFFKSKDSLDIIENSLESFAVANDNLKQIGLQYCGDELLNRLSPQLARKIVRLSDVQYTPQLSDFLLPFSSIVYLDLNTETDANLFNSISLLPQLTHLHLYFYDSLFRTLTQVTRGKLFQFPSVQVLTFTSNLASTSKLESDQWAYLFPNVQVIELLIAKGSISSHLYEMVELEESLSVFVQCPKLHHLYTREESRNYVVHYQNLVMFCEWIASKGPDRKIIFKSKKTFYSF